MAAVSAALIPVAAALSACSADGDDHAATVSVDPASLVGKTFVSDVVEGTAIPGGGPLEVSFPEEGRIRATAGCNRHAGTVTFDGGTLTTGPLAGTRMACAGERGNADAWLSDFFSGPVTWSQTVSAAGETPADPDGLLLRRGDQTVSLAQQRPTALVGTEWALQSLVRKQGVESSVDIEQADVRLRFGDDGRLTGNTGCNTVSGPATVSGQTITIGPLTTTEKACLEEGIADVEQAVLAVLAGAVKYEIDGDRLALTNAADPAIGLRLTAR